MSHTVTDIISCPQIQQDINDNFLKGDPTAAAEVQSFTDFVVNPVNTSNILQRKISPGGGKKRDVQLLWTPPILESEIGTSPAKKCTSSNEAGMLDKTYTLDTDEGVNYDEKFDLIHMASMCQENSLWFAKRLQAMMDGLTKKIGTINAEQLALLVGKFGTGDNDTSLSNTLKTISTRKTGSSDFNLEALEEIKFSAVNAAYPGIPYVFGFGEIYKYMKRVAAGCCTNDGLDIASFAAQNDIVFMADKKIYTALGADDDFIMVAPGAVQMLQWLEFEGANGINVINDEAYKQTVIVNPKNGMRFDLQIKNDCGTIYVNMKLAHKLVGLPDDLFSVGDAFDGVKWVNKFKITNA
jgi:hypothetical protein